MPRPLPLTYLFLSLAVMYCLDRWLPVAQLFEGRVGMYTGLALTGAAVVFMAVVAWSFRQHETTIMPHAHPSRLISSGVFAYSRNPIYVGMFVAVAGAALMFNSLTPWLVLPAFVLVIRYVFVSNEEAVLARRFGDRYMAYCREVGRWIGRGPVRQRRDD